MKIAVYGNDRQYQLLIKSNDTIEWTRAEDIEYLFSAADAVAYINLSDNYKPNPTGKPYFINSVVNTLKELNAATDTLRFNGWDGFLEKETWEVAGIIDEDAAAIFALLNKKIIPVADEPGLISARVIAMIINEAFFAAEEQVSKPAEIDIAMKLGTNYPYGPFEWAEKIGIEKIYSLLHKLSVTDTRYLVAPALAEKISG